MSPVKYRHLNYFKLISDAAHQRYPPILLSQTHTKLTCWSDFYFFIRIVRVIFHFSGRNRVFSKSTGLKRSWPSLWRLIMVNLHRAICRRNPVTNLPLFIFSIHCFFMVLLLYQNCGSEFAYRLLTWRILRSLCGTYKYELIFWIGTVRFRIIIDFFNLFCSILCCAILGR